MTEFNSIKETLYKIHKKKVSIKELNEIFIKRIIEKKNLNIFIYFNEEKVFHRVKELEKNFGDALEIEQDYNFVTARVKSKDELGARFDIKDFHHEILKRGALPLDILEEYINQWIAETKSESN